MRRRYSLVKYLQDAGYSSLALDRIGTGKSDHPPAELVTIETNVFVIDQVVGALRNGSLPGQQFAYAKIVGVGRSLSGVMIDMEAGVMHGLDGVIIQSFAHNPEPMFALFPTALMPAQLEPRLAQVPPGYYTTRPAEPPLQPESPRVTFFFQPPGSYDPAVAAHEEKTKETLCDSEVPTFPAAFGFAQQVTVPVLSILGDSDALFCAPPDCPASAAESGSYPGASSFEAHVIPGVGHDMNLQYNGKKLVFPLIVDWLRRSF
jgi:pimeloyl-ACP methyl ester carboxylesterase